MRLAALSSLFLAFSAGVFALPKVSRQGRYLYTEDGNRFYIKGVAYQEQGLIDDSDPNAPFPEPTTFIDPLEDASACQRDIPFLQQLSVNTVRIYSVDSRNNHDACMSALSQAGIYTIIDLATPLNGSIDRSSPSWSTNLLDAYINTINAFQKYDNVLAFNIGNEVIVNDNAGTTVAPFVKAAARDVRAYLNSIQSSALVGYAAIDGGDDFIVPLATYFGCDPSGANSGDTAIDLFGLNDYRWCGDASPSVYAGHNQNLADLTIPAYYSEYGCASATRLWTEVDAIFSEPMTDIWSGGVAFSYFPAQSQGLDFGMVTVDGSTVTISDDFTRLGTHYSQVQFVNTPSKDQAGATQFPACPAQDSTWGASNQLPPTPNDAACSCLGGVLSCLFTPRTSNTTGILGPLLDFACSTLGGAGGNCNDISSSGATGTYGRLAFCDPETKLSFVMSEFYEISNRLATSCDFGGNATVNPNAPSSISNANAAVSSCLSNPSATFTPTPPTSSNSPSPSGPNNNGNSGNGGDGNGAIGLLGGSSQALLGLGLAFSVSVLGSFLTLA